MMLAVIWSDTLFGNDAPHGASVRNGKGHLAYHSQLFYPKSEMKRFNYSYQ